MDGPDETSSLRAMAHPLRLRMLSLLTGAAAERGRGGRELGVTHANASYHLREPLDAGELEVAGEEKFRGGVAKRYRHLAAAGVERRPDPADLEQYVCAMATELFVGTRLATRRPRGNLFDAEVWVDPRPTTAPSPCDRGYRSDDVGAPAPHRGDEAGEPHRRRLPTQPREQQYGERDPSALAPCTTCGSLVFARGGQPAGTTMAPVVLTFVVSTSATRVDARAGPAANSIPLVPPGLGGVIATGRPDDRAVVTNIAPG